MECHPQLQQTELVECCDTHSIIITSYSPLIPLTDPGLAGTAVKLACENVRRHSPSQVLLRWNLDQSPRRTVVTTSRNKPRIEENLLVAGVTLSKEEVADISATGSKALEARAYWKPEFQIPQPLRAPPPPGKPRI